VLQPPIGTGATLPAGAPSGEVVSGCVPAPNGVPSFVCALIKGDPAPNGFGAVAPSVAPNGFFV